MNQKIDVPTPNPVGSNPASADPTEGPPVEPAVEPAARFGVFLRHGHRFAIPIECVVEVLRGQSLTLVPRAGPEVAGLLNLRGEILTVLLVDTWLNVTSNPPDESKPILVLCQEDTLYGIEVDRVEGVLAIPEDQIEAALPEALPAPQARCAGWWHTSEQPPCTVLAEDAFRDLISPLDVSADP